MNPHPLSRPPFNPRGDALKALAGCLLLWTAAGLVPADPGASGTTVELTPETEERLGIATTVVERQAVARTRTLGGEILVAGGGKIDIAAPIAGVVLANEDGRFLDPGARVRAGETLLRLLPLPTDRDLFAAGEEVARAEARYGLAGSSARRSEQLLEAEAGSERRVEEARAELADAEAGLAAARARFQLMHGSDFETVAETIAPLEITASRAGVVGAVRVAPGQSVAATTPLLQLLRFDPMWVRVPIYAGDWSEFDREANARVRPLSAPATAAGREARPVPSPPWADSAAASIDLVFELANPDGELRPGQRVNVSLALDDPAESILVSASAVIHDANGGAWVYEPLGGGTYLRRRVEISAAAGSDVVVTRGLGEGTHVVTVGAAELYGVEFYGSRSGAGH